MIERSLVYNKIYNNIVRKCVEFCEKQKVSADWHCCILARPLFKKETAAMLSTCRTCLTSGFVFRLLKREKERRAARISLEMIELEWYRSILCIHEENFPLRPTWVASIRRRKRSEPTEWLNGYAKEENFAQRELRRYRRSDICRGAKECDWLRKNN